MGNLDVGPTLSLAVAGRRSRGVATLKLSRTASETEPPA